MSKNMQKTKNNKNKNKNKQVSKAVVSKVSNIIGNVLANKPRARNRPPRSNTGRLGLSSIVNSGATNRLSQIIEEDEYIGEIAGSVAFATTQYPVNIGQSGTFPWGNKIASLYEKYAFESLEFYYKREVSEFATNGQSGKVMLSFDYDASDAAPTSKQQVEDTIPHIDGMPCSDTLRLRLDCAAIKKQPSVYVRPGLQPANTDIKTFDCGNLYVSTYGCANATVVGELRVKYRCRLLVPVLGAGANLSGTAGAQMLVTSAIAGEAAAATTVYVPLFASATTPITLANGIGATMASTGLITLPAGTYYVELSNLGTNTTNALTAGTLELNNVVTPNTGPIITSGAGTVITGDVSTHNDWSNAVSVVWPTASFGTSLCCQAALTYAGGASLNHATLRITQL